MKINPTPLRDIAKIINAKYIGKDDHLIHGFNEIHRVEAGDVVFVDHPKYYDKALKSAATTVIINKQVDCPEGKALIICEEPFTAFNTLTRHFRPLNYSNLNISPTAKIGKDTVIMPGAFVGNNVVIGDNTILHPNVVVYDNCMIGNNVIIHANTCIGSDAFYFKKRADRFEQLETVGRVIIHDNVQMGSGCTIDRGVTADTTIGKGCILDNQVHIGHDVIIGEMCLFAAQVGIAGACTIGNKVTMWGQVGLSSGLIIEDGAVILAQSGVAESIKAGMTYFGTPAADAKAKMREIFAARQLPDLIGKLYEKKD
jgi:UDP-3-O-[3-hydroxymyristoyl] glucosamine N-acyltransferase